MSAARETACKWGRLCLITRYERWEWMGSEGRAELCSIRRHGGTLTPHALHLPPVFGPRWGLAFIPLHLVPTVV